MSDVRFAAAIAAMNEAREKSGVDINGKKYSQVRDRVEVLRKQFGMEVGIDTDVFAAGDGVYIGKAKIIHTSTGNILGSGHAMAFYGTDEINTTSIVEAVETSAIGRALASFGLHGGEYASGQEMEALPQKQAAVNMSAKEREFRQEVDKHFPKVSQYSHYVPMNNSPDELDKGFAQIDAIEDDKELLAYYYTLEKDLWPMLSDDLRQEFINSFKYRKNQLKG